MVYGKSKPIKLLTFYYGCSNFHIILSYESKLQRNHMYETGKNIWLMSLEVLAHTVATMFRTELCSVQKSNLS